MLHENHVLKVSSTFPSCLSALWSLLAPSSKAGTLWVWAEEDGFLGLRREKGVVLAGETRGHGARRLGPGPRWSSHSRSGHTQWLCQGSGGSACIASHAGPSPRPGAPLGQEMWWKFTLLWFH